LPARPAAELKLSPKNDVVFPSSTSTPVTLYHTGSKNQAQTVIAWPAIDSRHSLAETADLKILSSIMQARMIEAMRPKSGASYTANVTFDGSWTFQGYGYLLVTSDTTAEKTQSLFDSVNEVVDSLRKDNVSTDEFERALQPQLATLSKLQQSNEFWSRELLSPDVDPQYSEWMRKQADYIKAVTPERVHAAAVKYLVNDKAWKAVMVPTAEPAPTAK
jgi:zinc protease